MLISAECYYDMYIKDKDVSVVKGEADTLRREISRLKRIIEFPSYEYEAHPYPDERMQLEACREYLSCAKKALATLGAECDTKEELAAKAIEDNNDKILSLVLEMGSKLEGVYELSVSDELCTVTKNTCTERITVKTMTAAEVSEGLNSLHLGEWHEEYKSEDVGSQVSLTDNWRVSIIYKGGIPPRSFYGTGVYPYNFDTLCQLLGTEK